VLDYLLQYGLFLVTTVVIAIGVVIRFLFNAIRHAREYTAEHLEVKNLNRRFEQMADVLNHDLLNPHERKAQIKAKKKEYKQRTKEQKKGKIARSRVFVLDFDGDIRASAVERLREEISAGLRMRCCCGSRAGAAWSIPTA
jgi:serine protease SohB